MEYKKTLVGFMTALTVMIITSIISKEIIEIPEMFIGWISCMGLYNGRNLVK